MEMTSAYYTRKGSENHENFPMLFTRILKESPLYCQRRAACEGSPQLLPREEDTRTMATRQQQRRVPTSTKRRPIQADTRRTTRRSSRRGRRWLIGLALVVGVSLFAWHLAVSHDVGSATPNGSTVATGTVHHLGGFQQVADQAVLVQGRLPVLFVSAQYCVFCAAERWALVDALERFGTLSQITSSQSAIVDGVSAPIPTYDLTQAQFASPVVDFQHVDVADQHGNALQQLTAAQQSRLDRYDPRGGIPFLDIGDAYVQVSSGYAPSLLQGLSFAQVQQTLADPTSTVGQTIHQEGTRITVLICQLESLAPEAVCQDPAVQSDLAKVN